MPDPKTAQRLKGLLLSATELQSITDWPISLIEDYLNIFDNLITISNAVDVEIDQKIEEIATDFSDGSVYFADGGFTAQDNNRLFWDNTNKNLLISNSATGTSYLLHLESRTSGDVVQLFSRGSDQYAVGIDDTDKSWQIAYSSTLGTGVALKIDTAENVTVVNNLKGLNRAKQYFYAGF